MLFFQDCVRWLPKSPKLHGSHNWNSQGSHWASLKGKENIQGLKLYKFSSVNENRKEGRISPEQEAEGLEDPDEDEPISKFSGSLFASSESIRSQRNASTPQEKQKIATKPKRCPATNHKQQVTNHIAPEGKKVSKQNKGRTPGSSEATQPLLKDVLISEPNTHESGPAEIPSKSVPINHVKTIPRIILTHPSTSDEDPDQITQDLDDSGPEELKNTEGHIYSDCLNHAFYPS
ncbi:FYN-binding protein 1-like [Crotalus tigris]|uniref:FYN-binding protein 1-like n=1 Tax=Crotalus tigris TaxID=88082 RepID=UPI00192F55EE|nr:FYN-binding protein 1-like [Crotalus tigris]